MKTRPIRFSGPMVMAILEGRKTQTIRIAKVTSDNCKPGMITPIGCHCPRSLNEHVKYCPYGQPGDRLYVKEKHKYHDWTEDGEPFIQYATDDAVRLCRVDSDDWGEKIMEIWAKLSMPKNYLIKRRACDQKWRPSIHMPSWASRITLEVVAVRVERLQDINEADALAEGCINDAVFVLDDHGREVDYRGLYASERFQDLWQSINGPGSWEKNPFVWVIEFRRVN
jgi:hypothetical protein